MPELGTFPAAMMEHRMRQDWSCRQTERAAGVAHSLVARLERGAQEDLRLSDAVRIATVLNMSLDALYGLGPLVAHASATQEPEPGEIPPLRVESWESWARQFLEVQLRYGRPLTEALACIVKELVASLTSAGDPGMQRAVEAWAADKAIG